MQLVQFRRLIHMLQGCLSIYTILLHNLFISQYHFFSNKLWYSKISLELRPLSKLLQISYIALFQNAFPNNLNISQKKWNTNSFTYFMIISYFISDFFGVYALLPTNHNIWNDLPRWRRGSGLEYWLGDPGSIPDVPSPSAGPLKAMGLRTSGCLRRGRLGT